MREVFAKEAVNGALEGRPVSDAIAAAGYSVNTDANKLMRPGSDSREKLDLALKEKGIDENWLLDKHKLLASKIEGGDEAFAKGSMAYVQSLKCIAQLLGHGGKPAPTVAVQVNNHNAPASAPGVVDPGTVARLAELVGEELSRRQSGEVLGNQAGDSGL